MDSDDSVEDDEETIDQAEKEDADDGGESHANELKQLEAEMDMPLEKLLAKYNQPAGSNEDDNDEAEDVQVEDNAEDWSESEGKQSFSHIFHLMMCCLIDVRMNIRCQGLTGESEMEVEEEDGDDDVDLEQGLQMMSDVDAHRPKKDLGIESLLDDSCVDGQGNGSKLSDAAALAQSFQPKGNTLESTQVSFFKSFSIARLQ